MQKNNFKTLVIGASENHDRYSNKAVLMLQKFGYDVVSLGNRPGKINGITIETENILFEDIHTITLYINPEIQKIYRDYILQLKPKRIIFNPGTENTSLELEAKSLGICTENACTLVLLSTGGYEKI